MSVINSLNLDAKAIDIVYNYITKKSSRWVSLRLPECMHIDGDAWVYEKYFEEQDDPDFVKETLVNLFLKEFVGKGNNRW